MTAQPTPPELDAHRHRKDWRDIAERWPDQAWSSEAVLALLAALDQAERRIARLEAQTDIRGRAVVIYRERARKAEAERDQAYEWADDQSHPLVMRQGEILTGVANALNGPTPPRTSWSHHDLAEKAAAMATRADRAEARIKAVEDVLDNPPGSPGGDWQLAGPLTRCIRRTLDGDA